MAESSNKSHFMDLIVRRLYYFSIRLDYFFYRVEERIGIPIFSVYPKYPVPYYPKSS